MLLLLKKKPMSFFLVIDRKIAVVGDACSRLPIIIRFHDLHAGDIRETVGVGEIDSYHERD